MLINKNCLGIYRIFSVFIIREHIHIFCWEADEIASFCYYERFKQLHRRGVLRRAECGPCWPRCSESHGALNLKKFGCYYAFYNQLFSLSNALLYPFLIYALHENG